ncbi:hypothetical protein KFL_013050020 [Klebsormidium nitens]|uniref:Uncharacterized protein n=1 Tax=Klebsormidium nitens TaxID=105231 RepID=A0A1Y1IQH2_KLENI|nr:hypothetical protein KFL_013050020 [Klebsormidium nitens]|eukprot:GAQ93110.1 hypothetical protein KFL_013050020 [Klebsormidium nitens]
MHDEELLDRFTRGLKPRTRMEVTVTMRDPRTFEETVKLADRMDSLYTPGFGLDRQPKGRFASAANPTPIPFRPADLPGTLPPDRGMPFHIETLPGATPVNRPIYRLSPSELEELRRTLDDLLAKGFIRL